jgi:hypothetical protein
MRFDHLPVKGFLRGVRQGFPVAGLAIVLALRAVQHRDTVRYNDKFKGGRNIRLGVSWRWQRLSLVKLDSSPYESFFGHAFAAKLSSLGVSRQASNRRRDLHVLNKVVRLNLAFKMSGGILLWKGAVRLNVLEGSRRTAEGYRRCPLLEGVWERTLFETKNNAA